MIERFFLIIILVFSTSVESTSIYMNDMTDITVKHYRTNNNNHNIAELQYAISAKKQIKNIIFNKRSIVLSLMLNQSQHYF